MTPCVYCIGCIYYRPKDKIWCCHEDADKCERREYYEVVDDDYPVISLIDEYDIVDVDGKLLTVRKKEKEPEE